MARLNRSFIVTEHQETTLADSSEALKRATDLNYLGYDRLNPQKDFVLSGFQANVNRVLLWLASKPNDYIRQSYKGGVLYALLAQKAADPDLRSWESEIKDRFNTDFSQDLSLVTLDLNIDKKTKTLSLHMIVQDNITNAMIPVVTGVSL